MPIETDYVPITAPSPRSRQHLVAAELTRGAELDEFAVPDPAVHAGPVLIHEHVASADIHAEEHRSGVASVPIKSPDELASYRIAPNHHACAARPGDHEFIAGNGHRLAGATGQRRGGPASAERRTTRRDRKCPLVSGQFVS